MKSLSLILLLMLLPLLGFSQTSQYQPMIERSKVALAYDPLNLVERLNLAYYQMLAGQCEQALENYRMVSNADNTNADAAIGILWALNSLGDYDQSLKEAAAFIKQFPRTGLLYHHLANARLSKGNALSARSGYTKALNLIDDPVLRQYPLEGSIQSYQALNDYPHSKYYLEQLSDQSLNSPKELLRKKLYRTSVIISAMAGLKDTTGVFMETEAIVKHRSMSYKLKLEEIIINDEHYRWSALVSARKQTRPLDVSLSALMIKSEDSRASEGYELSLEIRPRIYLSSILIRPKLTQHVASFTRFNTYQTDAGMEVNFGKATLSYQASYLYQDNDSLDSDIKRWINTFDMFYRLTPGIGAGLHAGLGDMAWYTSSLGSVTDDFEPSDSYYGASLSTGLGKHLRFTVYYQYGSRDNESSHLSFLRLAYAS